MKIAYLILAHNNPSHLQCLIDAISSPSAACFIHIDKKSTLNDFHPLANEKVLFSARQVAIDWGDFSMVEATLILMRQALADPRRFDRFVLLSGADYPLRSASSIETFFSEHPAAEFINLVRMPALEERKPMNRLTDFVIRPQAPSSVRFLRKVQRKLGISAALRPRAYQRIVGHLEPYAGDQWWALSREACQYILEFVQKEKRIINFFKNTFCPDEMFFQIILGNSPFASRIQRNVTYVDWGEDITAEHPAWIREEHLDALFGSNLRFPSNGWYGAGEMLFARKFSDERANVVSSAMQHIASRESCKEVGNV